MASGIQGVPNSWSPNKAPRQCHIELWDMLAWRSLLQPSCPSLRYLASSCQEPGLDHSALSLSLSPASFFGENHLEVPVPTALTRADLLLQFSTSQPEALLLLAAGQADHLLLQLYSGCLQVRGTPGDRDRRSFSSLERLASGCATSWTSPLPWDLGPSTLSGRHPRKTVSAYSLTLSSLPFLAPSWRSGLESTESLPSAHLFTVSD